MFSLLETTIELVVGYFALLVGTRLMGRSSIAESTPLDFVAVLVLGEFVGNAIYDPEVKIFQVIFAITIWALLIFTIDFITMKFHKTRAFFESEPSIVIKEGIVDKKILKKSNMDINRLQTILREKGVFSFREISYAILEPNGKISVIKKPMYQNVTRKDFDLPIESSDIPTLIISDGQLIERNLKQILRDNTWLKNELQQRGIANIEDVFLAEWSLDEGLFVQTKANRLSLTVE